MSAIPPLQGALPGAALPVVLFLFLLSGAAGLVYEVIWTRVLLTVFGATLYAVSTVLAAFMGGLALGSLAGGRLADRTRRPLLVYGVLELLIAGTALAVPLALEACAPVYRAVYASSNPSFTTLSLVRFALSFAVLLVPTTCMGATLPLLSRFLVRGGAAPGGRIGALYAINTTGAVAGAFLAGFVLIARFGTSGTILLAAGASATAGVCACLLSRWLERDRPVAAAPAPVEPQADAEAPPAWLGRLVLATYGVSGFTALAYQVFWTRALVFRFEYLKNTTYSFSAMLTVFLVGLASGSAFMSARISRQKEPVRLYGLIQILTGLSGAFSLFLLIHFVGGVQFADALDAETRTFHWLLAVANVFLRTALTIGLPTFLMGMCFPVAARICVLRVQGVGAGTGRLYAVNTLGAILGAFAAGFVLVPVFGLARGLLVLGLVNVVLGTVVLLANPGDTRRHKALWSVLAVTALALFFARLPRQPRFQVLEETRETVVDYREGPLATVSVVENSIGDRTLYVDNVGVAGTDRILLTDQKSLAHVPMLLLEHPESALTVGFGSGGASWSFLQYRELKRVDCIEICQTVPEAAHTLRASNHGVLDAWQGGPLAGRRFHDGRFRMIIDDARSYLRFTDARYDIIATDCTDLRYKSNANLYDVEYFRLCREAVTEDGMVVVWMPLGGMSARVFGSAMRTFAEVFPDMTIWYMNNEPTHYLLLLGTRQPLKINIARMQERIARPEIRADLEEVSLPQAEKILSCFLESAPAFAKEWADSPLNTERFPFLEFESPKFGYGDEPLLDNLDLLRRHRSSVLPYLEDAAAYPDFAARLGRFEQAVEPILSGHAFLRRLELEKACEQYLEALRLCPEDRSVQFLLTFDTLRRRVEREPDNLWAWAHYGQVQYLQKRYAPAANLFNRAIQLARTALEHPETIRRDSADAGRADGLLKQTRSLARLSVEGLAGCYTALGQPGRAAEVLAAGAPLLETDPATSEKDR